MKETLYDRVSYLAASNGMTIAEVERKADIGNGSIRRLKESIPSADKLYRVSKLFGTTMEDLLGYAKTQSGTFKKILINKTVKGLRTTDTGFIEREYWVQLIKDEEGMTLQIDDYIIPLGSLNINVEERRRTMLNNNDKYHGKEKFYLIEYNNGEFDDAECIETLYVVFRSLENAKEYIKRIPFEVDPKDYEEEIRDKLPSYRYYTYEIPQRNGSFEFYLEEDKFEEFLKCNYEKDSYYRIFEAWLLD